MFDVDVGVDFVGCWVLVVVVGGLGVIFYCVFDVVCDLVCVLEDVIVLGCEWVLIFGGYCSVLEGVVYIVVLV